MDMLRNDIQIVLFEERHQPEVELLLASIGEEFSEPISTKNTNKTTLPADLYLVAVTENRVIGTISITRLEKENAVLKKMFLHKNYRGQGVAALLLLNVLNWAKGNGVNTIYLGTMTQFKAAQKFYEKHHFTMIGVEQLPGDFPINPIDSVFYKLNLIHAE
jgi:GNAT superfamily N-acetyltransferase